jgi:hypothetical protein
MVAPSQWLDGVCSVAPPTTLTEPGRSAQIVRSYHGTSMSGQRSPITSVTIPVSKADMPSYARTATRRPSDDAMA